jgi:hypothetical protein
LDRAAGRAIISATMLFVQIEAATISGLEGQLEIRPKDDDRPIFLSR